MFELNSLYDNYSGQTPEALMAILRKELAQYVGLGFSKEIASIEKCFGIAKEYTDKFQKKPNALKNDKGEFIRTSGEPYINHTLRVALILLHEKMVDSTVIIAAIMHDLYEDTCYSYEQAKNDFGEEVAKLIDCVTNVSDFLQEDNGCLLSDEEIDYSNVINKCSLNPIAFFIKFADRYDNLMTLESMPIQKQLKKVEDTKKYILPIVHRLKAKRFSDLLDDAIFSIEERTKNNGEINAYKYISRKITEGYYLQSTAKFITALKKCFVADNSLTVSDLKVDTPSIVQIYRSLLSEERRVTDFAQSDILYEVYLISEEYQQNDLIRTVAEKFVYDRKLNEYSVCKVEKNTVWVTDDIGNRYVIIPTNYETFNENRYGTLDIDTLSTSPESLDDDLLEDKITIFTPQMDKIVLPKNSTVIDFAFMVHTEIGLKMKLAKVNDRTTSVFTVLNNKDKVEILLSDKVEAKLNWLIYCETKNARRRLVKWFREQSE